MKHTNIDYLDTEELNVYYEKALEGYKASLLNGMSWESVQEKRFEVSTLSIALYDRLQNASRHPAENRNRTT